METSGAAGDVVEPALAVVAAGDGHNYDQAETGDNVNNDHNGDEDDDDDDDEDPYNDGINIDHHYDPQHQPHHGIRANRDDQRIRRTPRQPGPSLSADPERAFAAICKSALADLAGWDAAAARLDAQAQLLLQRSVERSVREKGDDNARLRDAAEMRRLAQMSQAHTAKARFLRIVAQLQLAAWVQLRQQEADMRPLAAKA
jgi:hypothetical protein